MLLNDIVEDYYEARGLVWPDSRAALLWALTELAEAAELELARDDWVRNNPGDKEEWSSERFAEELGDVIFMCIVAAIVEGEDALKAMIDKLSRKLTAHLYEHGGLGKR